MQKRMCVCVCVCVCVCIYIDLNHFAIQQKVAQHCKSTIIFFFLLFRAAPTAYGSSQARGRIGAAATTATAMQNQSYVCNLHHSSRRCWISDPPTEQGQGSNCNLKDTSQIHFCCTAMGTPRVYLSKKTPGVV